MLEGWYCRSLANESTTSNKNERQNMESDDEPHTKQSPAAPRTQAAGPAGSSSGSTGTEDPNIDYKAQYRNLKRKLKFLIYENEYFQDLLQTNQRRLLKVSRDRSFLIDRLLLYEKPAKDSSDSDATDSSNSDAEPMTSSATQSQSAHDGAKESTVMRRKYKEKVAGAKMNATPISTPAGGPVVGGATRGRRRKNMTTTPQQPSKKPMIMTATATATVSPSIQQQHHQLNAKEASSSAAVAMSTAEITRQLQERRPTPIELMSPECASATVPVTMLSDESPSKIYPNESLQHLMEDDSPSHVAAEECVPMVYTN